MKIALVDIPNREKRTSKTEIPSLALGYLASVLEANRHKVILLDSKRWQSSFDNTYKKLLNERPDIVGFTSTSENRFTTINLIKKTKKDLGSFIIVGGSHFSFTAEDALRQVKQIDAVVRFEGENTLLELLEKISQNEAILDMPGVTYRASDGSIVSNRDSKPIEKLDELPIPAWHLFDLDLYNDRLPGIKDKSIGLLTSRGCPNLCSFCANASRSLRLRDPKNVIEEVEFLYRDYGYRIFRFLDDTLTINRKHIEGICREILGRNLDIIWTASARVNTVDRELLELMRKAGCMMINFGIESGSQHILNRIKKNITLDQINQAIRHAAELNYKTISAYFMVSLPGETIEDIDQTVKLMKELKKYGKNIYVTLAYTLIYPGTELERIARSQNLLPDNFSWNSYFEFPNYILTNSIPTIPYFEQKELKLFDIKAYLARNYFSPAYNLKRLLKKIRGIRNYKEFIILSKVLINYLFKKNYLQSVAIRKCSH